MDCRNWIAGVTAACLLAVTITGCGKKAEEFQTFDEAAQQPFEDEHSHGETGPHGGSLVEIGEHEHHAEVVIDHDAHKVLVYILGHDPATAEPIEAAELTLIHGEESYTLTAAPQESDPEGRSSRFELENDELIHEILDAGELEGTLVVRIGEQTYESKVDVHLGEEIEHTHE